MSLNALREEFLRQVEQRGEVAISEAILKLVQLTTTQGFDSIIKSYLKIDPSLPLFIKTQNIPTPQNNKLSFLGKASFLNLQDIDIVEIELSINENDIVDLLISVVLNRNWRFSDSFTFLSGYPFDEFTDELILIDSHFLFTTKQQHNYTWKSHELILQQGLNFVGYLQLRESLGIIRNFLAEQSPDDKIVFSGPINPTLTLIDPNIINPDLNLIGRIDKEVVGIPNFSLKNPTVNLRIDRDSRNNQYIWFYFIVTLTSDGLPDFEFKTPILNNSPNLGFSIEATEGAVTPDENIINLIGGEDFTETIPDILQDVFSSIGLKGFTLSLFVRLPRIKVTSLSVSIGTANSLQIGDLNIKELVLRYSILNPSSSSKLTFYTFEASLEFLPNIFTGEFDLEITSDSSGDRLLINGSYQGEVSLNRLIEGISNGEVELPNELVDISFNDFGVSFIQKDRGYDYSLYGNSDIALNLPILGGNLESDFQVYVRNFDNQKNYYLRGGLSIGNSYFTTQIDINSQKQVLLGSWKALNQDYLQIDDILSGLGLSRPNIPNDLDLGLKSAALAYDFKNTILVLEAKSINYGTALLIGRKTKQEPKRQFLFSFTVGDKINFSNLPLVGRELPTQKTVGVQGLQFLVASKDFTSEEMAIFNSLIPTNATPLPIPTPGNNGTTHALQKDFNVGANMQVGSKTKPLTLPVSADTQPSPPTTSPTNPPVTPNSSDQAVWFKIQKSFGPVYFKRVGMQYKDSAIWFLLDAAITSAGLTLTLDGLSVVSSVKKFQPKFTLLGIGIAYESKGAVSIEGALLRTIIAGKDKYSGSVIVKTKTFTISAIGSYTTTDRGHPSLFIYGILDKPIGGPPFFFVTGIALGFAYNRSLILPTLDRVPEFPLVRAAIKGGTADPVGLIAIQRELQPYIPPKVGQVMLAVGVKFTSFKIIESFVLLVATFGDRFSLELLGISTLVSPPLLPPNKPPLAHVRFAILARYVPSEGILKVEGKILPDSYLFDGNCRLSGGFAFYSWFSGQHEGDFVLTVGGYHPRFQIPPHYPRVDPLALNWRVSNNLSVKGSLYFALTASAIMAGGRLEAVWQSGNIKAWFVANAHFIVAWQPYSYDARIGVNLGGSYTFWFFGRQTISIEVGADLHIWGPKFSGTARIKLAIVSFTVRFGDRSRKKPKPINWSQFKQSFLPAKEEVCTIAVESGLLRKIGEGQSEIFILNPKEFAFTTSSVIPIKNIPEVISDNKKIGIAPMNINSSKFSKSEYSISIQKGTEEITNKFKYIPIYKNVPTGLWGESNSNNPNRERFVENVLSGSTIKPVNPPQPGQTQAIERKNLAYDTESVDNAYQWKSFSTFAQSAESTEDTRERNIGDSITSEAVKNARNNLLQSLGLSDTEIDLEEFETDKGIEQAFIIAPQLEEAII